MVLVTGATGTVGYEVARQLALANVKFRVMARDVKRVYSSPQIEVVQGALDDEASLAGALAGIETLFLLTNSTPTSAALQNAVIDSAKRHGLKRVVRLSVIGAALDSPLSISRWHAQTDAHLKASGLQWTILQPTTFMQNVLSSAGTVKSDGALYGAAGEGRCATIDSRDIAAAAVRVLSTGGHAGRTYTLTGQEALSYGEIAARLTRVVAKPVKYVDLPPAQFKAALLGAGLPGWLADDFVLMHTRQAAGGAAAIDPTLPVLIGDVRSYDDFLTTFGKAFKS